jgi:ubiquinone/menaquinone biosynthesis C-methylase UbiE
MFKKITRPQLALFLAKYKSDKKILDIGSGGSSYSNFFPHRLTVDIDPLRKPDIVADAHNLPFKDGEFEMVLCTEVLEHVLDPKKVIAELNRVLVPGGILILTTRFMQVIHDAPHDYWRFTKYGMQELFREWETIELKEETSNFTTIAVLLQRLCFQTKMSFNAPVKFLLFLLAEIFTHLNFLIKEEFGDIKKEKKEHMIMASGYYIAARKKS